MRSIARLPQSSRARRHPARSGQSLLELAIFGAMIIMLLGMLVSFGMTFDFNQYASMRAFREALGLAATISNPEEPNAAKQTAWGTASYSSVTERHLPNPSGAFAVGGATSIGAGAGVTRTHQLANTADSPEELPRTRLVFQGKEFDCASPGKGCTTAGFRTFPVTGVRGGEEKANQQCVNGKGTIGTIDVYEEFYGQVFISRCPGNAIGYGLATVIDPCEGEMINYDTCMEISRRFDDPAFCVQRCKRGRLPGEKVKPRTPKPVEKPACAPALKKPRPLRGPWDEARKRDAEQICAPSGAPPLTTTDTEDGPSCEQVCALAPQLAKIQDNGWPWYAGDAGRKLLGDVFATSRMLGLQPDMVRKALVSGSVTKSEKPGGIETTASLNEFEDSTSREMRVLEYRAAGASTAPVIKKTEHTQGLDPKQVKDAANKTWTVTW